MPDQLHKFQIYRITNPVGAVYIGKTHRMDLRLYNYKKLNCKTQPLIYNSLSKYGFKNHSFDIIDEFVSTQSFANGKEKMWIRSYMSNLSKWRSHNGLNLTDGGDGAIGRRASDEQRKKLSELRKGREFSEEIRRRAGDRIKVFRRGSGWNHTAETRLKMSIARKGKPMKYKRPPMTEDQKMKLSKVKGHPVIQMDINGNYINEFISIKQAAEQMAIPETSMHCLINSGLSRGNFIFKRKS